MSGGFGWRVAFVDEAGEPFVLAPPSDLYGRARVKLTEMEVGHSHGRLFEFRELDSKYGYEVRRMLEDALGRIVKGFVQDHGETQIVLNDLLTWAERWPRGRFHVS